MKKFIILFIFSLLLSYNLRASDDVKNQIRAELIKQFKVGNYHLGSKYIVAIPPNETKYFSGTDASIEIHVSAKTDAFVKLNILGVQSQTKIAAGDILKIDETMGLNKSTSECREYNLATSKTITIEADVPVAVSVFNLKSATGEGYSAIPVDQWGTSYLHSAYYDNRESLVNEFSGGFLILGSEDDTEVDVNLRGIGDKNLASIKNDLNKSIGDKISFTLDEGEVYQIAADGKTLGEFDLSGTAINANKPIGVISYHLRTVIPIFMSSSRDHICEMMSPVKSLSTDYASIAFERDGSDKGDLFRIIATEDNTAFSVKWYDLDTKKMLNSKSGILQKAGDFQEISSAKSVTSGTYSITGSSIFKSDKPIMIMQYAYSGAWDNKSYDPFMLSVPAIDQYLTHTVIQTPPTSLIDCKLTLIAKVEEGDDINARLSSIMLDGNSLTNTYPTFSTNRIPGTNLFWLILNLQTGTHYIYGDGIVKFGAFQYGVVKNNNYGFPVAGSYKSKFEKDTMLPEIAKIGDNPNPTVFELHITDNKLYETDSITYKDSKIWFDPLTILDGEFGFESYNFKQPATEFEWKYEAHDDYNVRLEVEDIYAPASAKFFVADYAGNITIDSLNYTPNLLQCTDSIIDFGKIPVTDSKQKILSFVNTSGIDFKIRSILLSNQNIFSIDTIKNSGLLLKDDSLYISINYTPNSVSSLDKAILSIETDNITHQWELLGSAFEDVEVLELPSAKLLDFGLLMVGDSKTKSLTIRNTGKIDIDIDEVSLQDSTLYHFTTDYNNTTLKPGESQALSIIYTPIAISNLDSDSLIIKTSKANYSYPIVGKADIDDYVEEQENTIVRVAPNPADNEARIQLMIDSYKHLEIYLCDIKGSKILTIANFEEAGNEQNFTFDATNITPGAYTLFVKIDERVYTTRIVILR